MKTLQIESGDIVVGPGGAQVLRGQAKLVQDLSIAVAEPYGCDRFHPRWGTVLTNYVGLPRTTEIELLVRSEVTRVVGNYMANQTGQVQADAVAGLPSRLASEEIISAIDRIDVQVELDQVRVRVAIRTLSGDPVSLRSTVRT